MVEGATGLVPRLGHPDLLHRCLGFGLHALGQVVEYVSHFMDPTALRDRIGENFFRGRPESQCSVAHRQPWGLEAAVLQSQQHFTPALLGFPDTILNGQEPLLAALVHPDDDQGAQLSLSPRMLEYTPSAQP